MAAWLPQNVSKLQKYASLNPQYGVTLCEVLNPTEETFPADKIQMLNASSLLLSKVNSSCRQLSSDTYTPSLIFSVLSLILYLASGKLAQWFGSKTLLNVMSIISAGCCFGLTIVRNLWMTLTLLVGSSVILSLGATTTVGMTADSFPTHVRSTATSICMVCGRCASSIGILLMGQLQRNYCDLSYYGLAALLCGVTFIGIIMPTGKKVKVGCELQTDDFIH